LPSETIRTREPPLRRRQQIIGVTDGEFETIEVTAEVKAGEKTIEKSVS
jgi:hypothetical protein